MRTDDALDEPERSEQEREVTDPRRDEFEFRLDDRDFEWWRLERFGDVGDERSGARAEDFRSESGPLIDQDLTAIQVMMEMIFAMHLYPPVPAAGATMSR